MKATLSFQKLRGRVAQGALLAAMLMVLFVPLTTKAQTTLLSENFDNMSSISTSYSSTGWYAYKAGSGNNWTLNTSSYYANSGSNSAQYQYNSSYAANCYLVSAPFTVSANMSELSVSLYERVASSYYSETFEVFFVKASNVTSAAGVTSATHYNAIASATYTNQSFAQKTGSVTSSELAGQSVRVVVHCTSEEDMYNLYIDDITVTETTSGGGGGGSTTEVCPTIGTGSTYSSSGTYGGIYTYFNRYAYTQQLYTQSELSQAGASAGTVHSIALHYNSSSSALTFEIYLGQTDQNTVPTTWISDADLTLVYAGTTTFSGTDTWNSIDVSSANWQWDGESNIVVAIRRTNNSAGTVTYPNFYYTDISNMAAYYTNSSSSITLNNNKVPSSSGTSTSQRPEIKFCIEPGTGPSCPKPTDLTIVADGTSAMLTWNGTASSYTIAHSTSATANPDNNILVNSQSGTSYTANNLTLDNDHYFWVRANCGGNDGNSNWAGPVSVHIGYCVPTMSSTSYYITNFTTTGAQTNINNSSSGATAYTNFYNSQAAIAEAGNNIDFSISMSSSGSSYGYAVWVDWDNSLSFESNERMYASSSYTYPPLTGSFTVPAGTAAGNYRMRIIGDYSNSAPANPCSGSNGEFEDYMLTIQSVACPKPTAFTAVANGTSATLTWSGTASSYTIAHSTSATANPDNNILVTSQSATSYTASNLTLDVDHYFWVRANCGGNDGNSTWAGPVSVHIGYCVPTMSSTDYYITNFTTTGAQTNINNSSSGATAYTDFYNSQAAIAEAEDNINFSISMSSSGSTYGYAVWVDWDNSLSFESNERMYASSSYTYPPLTGSFTVPAGTAAGNYRMRIIGDYYDSAPANPCSGNTGEFEDYMLTIQSIACPKPTNLVISDLTGTTATLSWTETGEATSWAVEYSTNNSFTNSQTINVNGNPTTTITSLSPTTVYYVRVKAVCGGNDGESRWTTGEFTTTESNCPTPAATVSDITGNTASISWTGQAESYNVRYRISTEPFFEDFENGLGNWTTIDADGDGFDWVQSSILMAGYSIPSYSGEDMVSSQSYNQETGEVLYPDNWLVSPAVPLGGSVSFWAQAQDPEYPDEHFAIYVSTTSNSSPDAFTQVSQEFIATGDYLEYTADLSQFSGTGYIAIRHFNCQDQFYLDVDAITITPGVQWTEIENISNNSYTLCGLDLNTTYQVQVQANCGVEDGISGWSTPTTFTTTNTPATFTAGAIVSDYVFPCDNPYNGQTIGEATAATGINLSYQWQRNGQDIEDANDATYTITADELSQLAEGVYTYTRLVNGVCSANWEPSEGTFTLDLRVPSQPTTEYIDTVTCGDPVTITADAGSNIVVRYFWYDQPVNDNNRNFHVAITEAERYTTGHLLTGDTTLYVCAVTYKVDGADTTDLCWSTPDTINIHVNPIVAPTITAPAAQYCGSDFTITPNSNSINNNHSYIWYKDAACSQEQQTGFTLNLTQQYEETDFYLREFYNYNPGDGYICGSAPQSVHITLKPIEAPDYIDPVEICKGIELSLAVNAPASEGTEELTRYIAWYLPNDPEDTQIIDTTLAGQAWSDYTTLDGRSWHDLLGESTTLYVATATKIIYDNGPKTLTLPPHADVSNQLQGVFVTFQAGNIRVELDSIDLIPAQNISSSESNLSVYYRTGTIDYATCTDPAEWTALSASIDDGEAGHPTSLHLGESITLEAGDVISLFISAPGESFYYNEPSSNNTGIIASDNFITARTGWGFTYNSVVTGGFPTAEVSLTPRNLCGTVHYTVAGELTFGCLSARTSVVVTVDSLPRVSAISGTVEPLCDGESLAADVLAALTPTVTWNTANEQSQTAQWMLSVDDADAVVLDDNTNIFRHGHDYTLIYRATNNCNVNSPDHQEATTNVEVYGAPTFTNGNAFTFTNSSENLCINSAISVQMPAWNNNGSEATEHWQYAIAKNAYGEYIDPEVSEFMTLDLQQGIADTGDYYIRGYVKNDCGGDTTAIKTVSVYSKPAIEPVAETSLAFCFGAEINPTVPEVSNNKYIAATGGRWLKVQDDELLDPVELTFPQTADMTWNGVRICYAATNDCGTTYSDTITLTVYPDIALTVSHNLTADHICPAVGVELTATTAVEGATFEWSNVDEGGLQATTGNPVTAKNGSEETEHYYTVVATDVNGCHDTAATTVAVVFRNDVIDSTIEICELELPYTYTYGDQDTTLQRAGNHIVKFPQADGCDYVVNLTLAIREVTIIDYHGSICAAGESYIWDAVEGLERTYTEAADDTVHVYYTGSQCDSILYCIHVTQGEPSLVVTDPQLSGSTGETLSTTVFGRSECDNNIKVAIEYDLYKDGELVNPDDYGTLNFTTAIPTLNLSFGRNVHAASGSIPASTFNMYNYQYGYFYLGFFGTAPNTVTATWNEPGEYKIVFRVVGRTGGMDYPYQSEPGVVIGGGGGTTTSVYATDSLIMRVSGEGGNEGQDADVNNGQNGMITISAVQDNPVIGATSTFAVNIENPNSSDPKTKVALDYEVYRDGQLLSELNGYGTLNFATYYDGTPAMVGRDLEYPDGSIPTATFHVGYYSYGYFTLGFWSQTNNEFTANWQQPGEYKVVFRLVERTGGTPYPLTYGTSTNDTIGGANGSNTGTVLDTNAIVFYIPVAEPAEADIDTIVCESNLPVTIHGTVFDGEAQQDLHVYSDNGVYDTIYHLTLTVAPAYTAENPVELDSVVCAFPFEWNGVTFEEAGSQTANLQTVLGCDSVVRMTVTLSTETGHKATEYACGSYIWHEGEEPITVSGTYTYNYENDYGCALTDTLDLTVYSTATTPDVVTVCGSYIWHEGEEPITVSGTYYYDRNVVYDNITCPVTDTLVLTVNPVYNITDEQTLCASELPYTYGDTTFQAGTVSGTYTLRRTTAEGCDSIVTLTLTVNPSGTAVIVNNACGSYTWENGNGETYTESGTYTYEYVNNYGCNATDTLLLTVHHPVGNKTEVTECGEFEWNGIRYTESGTYYADRENEDDYGCIPTDTLVLTINPVYSVTDQQTLCASELPYTYGDTLFDLGTASGTYTVHMSTVEGCDSIVTLDLTVNPVYNVSDAQEISVTALPYTYADTTFELGTQSGEYTVHLLTAAGCDSVVTLTLTVTGGSEGDAFLTVESISDNEFTVTAFANQVDPAEKVAIAYSITKDGEPVNIISHDCGGDLYIATDFNGSEFGQYVSYGEGTIPGNTFMMTTHYHDYFYFHFLNGRTNRFAHTFTEEGEYVVTLTLMSRTGGSDIFVPYAFEGSNMLLIGGEGSTEGSTLDTKTVTFSVGGGSNEPVNPAPMGVDGYTQQPEVTLFPNPARDIVTLRTNVENAGCTITDMSGKVVLSATADKASDLQINVSQWAAGVYFVNLRSNGATVTQKLVITK